MSRSDHDTVGVPKHITSVVIANQNAIFTVPTGKIWRLLGASGTFSTVATGADREIRMNITPNQAETVGVESSFAQPPSLQRGWLFSPDVPNNLAFTTSQFGNVQCPSLLLVGEDGDEGEVILTAGNSVAGDQWVDPILHVIEYEFQEAIPSGG